MTRRKNGAGNGIRTRDLNLGKVALYQLSYSRSDATHGIDGDVSMASSVDTHDPIDLYTAGSDKVPENHPMPRYVYSPHYRVDIGPHVFPTLKYDAIRQRLIDEDGVLPEDFVEPEPATEDEILVVHTREYFEKCRDNRLTMEDIWRLEMPWSPPLFELSVRSVRGSILAAEMALVHGAGLHVGGGFHHAYPDHGEGFCVFNDHCCAIRWLQAQGAIEKALVADCDLHHGNGTAAIFAGDPTVATFSIHQDYIYPAIKPPSTIDVGLLPGTDDRLYLREIQKNLLPLLDAHQPDLVAYVAGADPYREDQLGSLGLTQEGLERRDELIAQACAERDIPLFVVLAGGYALDVADTISIHLQTLRQVRRLWRPADESSRE